MSTQELGKWFRVLDNTGNNKAPVDLYAKDEAAACLAAVHKWFGQLPGCRIDSVLEKVKAVPYTDDGRITKIEAMEGLSGKQCLPPGGWTKDESASQ